MRQDYFKEINIDVLEEICSTYLTQSEHDIVFLILHGRRNKELSMILNIQESEVVRLKRNIIRKIKTVHKFHYKLNYIDFFRFASNVLTDRQMQYLIRHYRDLRRLHEISDEFKTQTSNVHRALRTIGYKLDKAIDRDSPLREFLDCFTEMPYLNIREIRRNKQENDAIKDIQIGENTLGEWEEHGSVINTGRDNSIVGSDDKQDSHDFVLRPGYAEDIVGGGHVPDRGVRSRRQGTRREGLGATESGSDETVEGTINL